LNNSINNDVDYIITNENLDNYLGKHKKEKKPFQVYQSNTEELFDNYSSFVKEKMNIDIDIDTIRRDILKGAFYIRDVEESDDKTLINLLNSYRSDPDGEYYFDNSETHIGPISYALAKAVSLSSNTILIPENITTIIEIWKEEQDERIPDKYKIKDLLTTQINSQYELSRYLYHWPIKTTSPVVVFSGIGESINLPEYQEILEPNTNKIIIPYFISTSYDINVAKRFSGERKQIICIVIPPGFQLTVISNITPEANEREILLNIGSELQRIQEPFQHNEYNIHCYLLLSFHLPKKKQINKKINLSTKIWIEGLIGDVESEEKPKKQRKSRKNK
jgi:hypothetical protein